MRLIDADKFLEDETKAYISAQRQVDEKTHFLNWAVHMKTTMLIKDAPTEDVVSREQYSMLYEENMQLRSLLARLEDDKK